MSHIKDHTEQGPINDPLPRRKLTALGTTTALALLGITLIFLFLFLLFWLTGRQVVLPILVVVAVFAFTAGFVATGVRWASVLGSFVALGVMIFLFVLPLGGSALRNPTTDVARFSELVLVYALAVIALVAGVAAAAIQNYRSTERHAPRWLGPLLAGLSGLAAGMIAVALLTAASPQSISASTTIGGMLVPKGEKLLLVDDDSVEHIIQNGSWTQSGTPQSQEEPGAPVVHNRDIKGGSVTIGPFTTAGVFHLYCTIHRGMNLTVLVQ